jgi:hypothetical protein
MAISCNQAKVTYQDHFVKHWLDQITRFSELDNTSVVKGIILHRWLGAAAAGIKHDNLQTVHSSLVGTSVVDPDPDWIRIQLGPWIRIQTGKNGPQKRKKLINFMF